MSINISEFNNIEDVINTLIDYSNSKFDTKLMVKSSMTDEEIALFTGVNMLGEELEYSTIKKDFFETIFNSTSDYLIITNKNISFLELNLNTEKLFNKIPPIKSKIESIVYELIYNDLLNEEKLFDFNYENITYSFLLNVVKFSNSKNKFLINIKDISSLVQKEQNATYAIIENIEYERKRLANDIHDSLGQELNALNMFFQTFKLINSKNKYDKNDELINYMEDLISSSIKTCKNITYDLLPAALQNGSLIDAFESITKRLNLITSINIDFSCNIDELSIKKDKQIYIYRIAQEFINNSIKHSDCKSISIILDIFNGNLILSIADDGKGFDINSITRNNGLNNIEARINYLNCSYKFESLKGIGTYVYLILKNE